ncbi:hypothetical protein ON010_g18389 [Phytophthora cinnamomi]|nr:hypothetical protein ON010_g18389 [Phytophthora cinnamomi]
MLAKALVLNNIKKKVGLESCTACYSVLAPLDFELERLFKTVDTPIYQLFGTAETCGFAAINFQHAWEFGSSGRALPGTTIRCDERSQETVLRGRNVFVGYRYAPHGCCSSPGPEHDDDDSQYTSTCDSDGWLRLWQRGFLTPTGFLKISDPRDFLVLSTGDWVPIHPFEFAMMELMPELDRVVLVGDGRTFLSALFFLKTNPAASRSTKHTGGGHVLDEDALKVGHAIGSPATTVGEAIRCQHWAVHFDGVLEDLPQVCSVSGFRVRKWILMAADFTVESGELDPDTGDVCRRAVDRKYQALLDSLYS